MNTSILPSHFEGISGALIVSVVAFSIVFIVLAGLTAVIYAIKTFSGGAPKSTTPAPASVPAPTAAPVTATTASLSATPTNSARVTAVITAAILAATGGHGKILSVTPEKPRVDWTQTWRISGRLDRLASRLVRTWKH